MTATSHETEFYVLGDASMDVTTNLPQCYLDYSPEIPAVLSNAVNFDLENLSFQVHTSDESLIGTYLLNVTAGDEKLTI